MSARTGRTQSFSEGCSTCFYRASLHTGGPYRAFKDSKSAWRQLSVPAHCLVRSFQLQTLAIPKSRSCKRIYAYTLGNMRTLRVLLSARAGAWPASAAGSCA